MSIIRDQYNKLSALHKKKTAELEERAQKESEKLDSHTTKRKLELEGYTSDL